MSYTPTETDIKQLRLITGEYPAETSAYTDEDLTAVLEARDGDIHAAASDIWTWKAAKVASKFDFSADGGEYKMSGLYNR